jgi:hypothetical protein
VADTREVRRRVPVVAWRRGEHCLRGGQRLSPRPVEIVP